MARYGQAFKDKAVARLLPPESASLADVARKFCVSLQTLEKWRDAALSQPAGTKAWTPAARFGALLTTAAMNEQERSAWCRSHGVDPQQFVEWRTALADGIAALVNTAPVLHGDSSFTLKATTMRAMLHWLSLSA